MSARAQILLITYRSCCRATAELYRLAAAAIMEGNRDSIEYDDAAFHFKEAADKARAELKALGYEWSDGEPEQEALPLRTDIVH